MAVHSTSPSSTVTDRVSVETHIQRLRAVLESALSTRQTEMLPLTPTLASALTNDRLGEGQRSAEAVTAGRVSAAEVSAPAPLPGFDNSQMDGFAVRCADLGTPVRPFSLPLAGVVPAGTAAPDLPAGECMAVMTGAPVPAGADAIIPVENTVDGFAVLDSAGETQQRVVQFTESSAQGVHPGTFIRRRGSDVAAGDVLLHAREVLTPAKLGLLAACGIAQVEVLERVRTLVLATGHELRRPGEPLGPGQLYDANATLLRTVCEGYGHTVATAMIPSDEEERFSTTLDGLITQHRPQLIITAGGISAGAYEVVRQALTERGVHFGAVAQQPGGPQGWGVLEFAAGAVALIALPGNPVSCAVSLETLVRPALAGLDPACPGQRRIPVVVGERLASPPGVRQFRRVELFAEDPTQHDDAAPTAKTIGGPSSHLLGHLARADALLELREDDTEVPIGARREAILL